MAIEYHKGEQCIYRPILCQEGYCFNCHLAEPEEMEFDRVLRAYLRQPVKLDCTECLWNHPDACRSCWAEQREKAEWSVGYRECERINRKKET